MNSPSIPAGMAVAYGIGMPVPGWPPGIQPAPVPPTPHPFGCLCGACAVFVTPVQPTLPVGLTEAAEAVRVALREQQEAERVAAEASIMVEAARAKYRAAVEHLVRVSEGGR